MNKKLNHPTFLIKPFYQSPQDRCRVYYREDIDLGVQHTLSHRTDIPNSVFDTYLLYQAIIQQARITSLQDEPEVVIRFPHDADTILYSMYVLNTFFERHMSITFQLFTKPATSDLQQVIKPCYINLQGLPRLKSVHYVNATSSENACNMKECKLQSWTKVEITAPNWFEITFPAGSLIPFAPKNAQKIEFITEEQKYSQQEGNIHPSGLHYVLTREHPCPK